MKNNTLKITIKKSVHEVLSFVLNPLNTPKWVFSILEEEVNEIPTKLGTVYRNVGPEGVWHTYTVTEFKENNFFTFTSENGNYHFRYSFHSLTPDTTEIEYQQWVDTGELKESFMKDILEELKEVLESE